MPWYNDLRPSEDPNKQDYSLVFPDFSKTGKIRTIDNLLKLREYISENIQVKKNDKNLILSSWNIKQFGFLKQRLPESYFYIAEIISSFDLVAVQEIKKGLKDLEILMKLLGSDWHYLMTDVTEGNAGNSERFAYIYNTKRVDFTGLAGEIVLWKELFEEHEETIQLKRSPYMTGFRAGWKSFALLSVHLQPGNDTDSKNLRKREVEFLMKALAAKKKAKTLWTENIIILGDFNLYKNNTEIFDVFEANEFIESNILEGLITNTAKSSETFDRMFFKKNEYFEVPTKEKNFKGGVINIFDILYTLYGEYKTEKIFLEKYADDEAKAEKYFKNYWRKDQMSDHNPIWIEIDIDSTDQFLRDKRKELEK